MFSTSWICKSIKRNQLLLENQPPIFVLDKLYRKVCELNNSVSFLELVFNYFEDYYPHKSTSDPNKEMVKNFESCKHFTNLVRLFCLLEKVHGKEWMSSEHFTPCGKNECVLKTATKLNEAGVSIEKVHPRSLLEIKFKKVPILIWYLCLGCSIPCSICVKARLQIPQLKVLQTT